MAETAYLILENGTFFEGEYFGSPGDVTGEIVFTTGMSGYLETLTDQSYYGQIVLQAFPLIGNYGVIPEDFESSLVGARAYIAKYPCKHPSNFRSQESLDGFLKRMNVTGISGIDTRALIKIIRQNGVMNGKISRRKPDDQIIDEIRSYKICDAVKKVSVKEKYLSKAEKSDLTVVLLDFGFKRNMLHELNVRGCDVWILPADSDVKDILGLAPDGIVLSNGPGDPAENTEIIQNLKKIFNQNIPTFGICLGHQLLALSQGFRTCKMKYGHRGANQPVKEKSSGRVFITSQNHGYAVVSESINTAAAEEWFVNVNDRTCEGIIYKNAPVCSVQFHPEACGGPKDMAFLFDRFVGEMKEYQHAHR